MKSIPEITEAIKQAEAGIPINRISRQTGIDKKTINVYLSRYRMNKGTFQRSGYTLDFKMQTVKRHLDNGTSVPVLSSDCGIPAITIRRWIQKYKNEGPDGLKDKRSHKSIINDDMEKQYKMEQAIVNKAIYATIKYFLLDRDGHLGQIPEWLRSKGAFRNPSFGCFLIYILHMCRHVLSEPGRVSPKGNNYFSESETARIIIGAKLMFTGIPYEGTQRRKADMLLMEDDTYIFLNEYIETLPLMLIHYEKEWN